MAQTYGFHPFDWAQFRAISTPLAKGYSTGDFSDPRLASAQPVLAELEAGLPLEQVCNAVALELCCLRSGIVFHGTLFDELRALRRSGAVDAADQLTDLVLSGMNTQGWFRSESGLIGIMTEDGTRRLARLMAGATSRGPKVQAPRGFMRIVAQLMAQEPDRDLLAELAQLATWSAEGGYGLAAVGA
jgi:hypothetical protein